MSLPTSSLAASPPQLSLRPGLRCTPFADEECVLLEDTVSGRFYRLGFAEYALVEELGKGTALPAALAAVQSQCPDRSLTAEQAQQVVQWLVGAGLIHAGGSSSAAALAPAPAKPSAAGWTLWFQWLFSLRIPLGSPDSLLAVLEPRLGWLFSPLCTVLALAVAACVLTPVALRWRELTATMNDVFTTERQLALVGGWLLLKVVHELGHGLVCKRYGGQVREAGLTLLLLAPLAYIDVTSAWRFPSKWARIHVSLAGVHVELLVGALAGVVWLGSDAPGLRQAAGDVLLMATATTILFNLNPLMKFDGYYVLSDWLPAPNLAEDGRLMLRYFLRRWLLGQPAQPPGTRRPLLAASYGLAAGVWRVTASLGLLAAGAALFQGGGVLFAVAAAVAWHGPPLLQLLRDLFLGSSREPPPARWRAAAVVTGAGLCCAGLCCIPVSWRRTAPAIVEYDPPAIVRAPQAGFLDAIYVRDGQLVAADEPLCLLRNDELGLAQLRLETQLAQSQLRAQALLNRLAAAPLDYEKYQAAEIETTALAQQLAEAQARSAELVVRAPRAGRVSRRRLETLLGTYLQAGDEIVWLGLEEAKRLRVSLAVEDLLGEPRSGLCAWASFPGRAGWSVTIAEIAPRATREPPDPALCAPWGGTLAVSRTSDQRLEFFEPRFSATAPLARDDAAALSVGQRGVVALGPSGRSLGAYLWSKTADSFEQVLFPRAP